MRLNLLALLSTALPGLLTAGCMAGDGISTTTRQNAISGDEVADCVAQYETCGQQAGSDSAQCESVIKTCLAAAYDYDQPVPTDPEPSPCSELLDTCLARGLDPDACFPAFEQCQQVDPPTPVTPSEPCTSCEDALNECLNHDINGDGTSLPQDLEQGCHEQFAACSEVCEPPTTPEPCTSCEDALNECLNQYFGEDGTDPSEGLPEGQSCHEQFAACSEVCEPPTTPEPCTSCEDALNDCLNQYFGEDGTDPSEGLPEGQSCHEQFAACSEVCEPPTPTDPCAHCAETLEACLQANEGGDPENGIPAVEPWCQEAFETCTLDCYLPPPAPTECEDQCNESLFACLEVSEGAFDELCFEELSSCAQSCEQVTPPGPTGEACDALAMECFATSQGNFDDLCDLVYVTCIESAEPLPTEPSGKVCDKQLDACLGENPEDPTACFDAHEACLPLAGPF